MMVACAAFLVGLALARMGLAFHNTWLALALTISVVALPRLKAAAVLSAVVLGLTLGALRGSAFLERLQPYQELSQQRVELQAVAETDGVYDDRGQLTFDASQVQLLQPDQANLPGRIKLAGFGVPAVFRGDQVRAEGKLFLTRGSRQASVGFADITVVGRSNSPVETVRHDFVAGMATALPEPHASFGLGLLIGQRSTLPENVTAALSAVGLTHIIAVSGYNLTIIVRAVRRFGRQRSKYQITILSVVLIGAFLLVTGFSASIVRAAIVSGLGLAAWYYGRTFRPLLILLITAALTAGWYPLYLWSDIGWHLSFLAFYGVLVLAPLIVRRLGLTKPKPLTMLLMESFCAQLMTFPLILYIFQEFSAVALLSNLLVVPFVPLAMLLSLVAGLAGMLVPTLAGIIAWPAQLLLTYILDIAQLLARLPHALIPATLSLPSMVLMYSAVAFVSLVLWRKTLTRHATITDENI